MNAKWLSDPLSLGHKIFPFSLCLLFLDGIKVCPTSLSDLYITENTSNWQGWVVCQNASLIDWVKWKEMKGSHQNLGRNCKIDLHIELQNSSEHISEFIRFQIISRGQQQEREKEKEQELQEGDKKRKYPKAKSFVRKNFRCSKVEWCLDYSYIFIYTLYRWTFTLFIWILEIVADNSNTLN